MMWLLKGASTEPKHMSGLYAKPGEEYLKRVVVNTAARIFTLHSNQGHTKEIKCISLTEFMGVLNVLRDTEGEHDVIYSEPKVQGEI